MSRRRAFLAIAAPMLVWAASIQPATSAPSLCTTAGGVLPPVGDLLGSLTTGIAPVDEAICAEDPTPEPSPEPSTEPSVTPSKRPTTEPTSTGGTVAAPAPRERASAAVIPVVPVVAPSKDPSESPGPTAGATDPPTTLVTNPAASSTRKTAAGGVAAMLASLLIGVWIGRARGTSRAAGSHAMLGALLDTVPESIIVGDADGRVVSLNRGAEALLRVRASSVGNAAIWTVTAGETDDGRSLPSWIREHVAAGGATTATLRRGVPVAISVARVLGSHDRPVGTICVVRDLSIERSLERMKTEILSNVGHELRTPLTSALGFARMLREREVSADQQVAFLSAIVDSCERLDRVVDLLVDVAALEGGRFSLDDESSDLVEMVRQETLRVSGAARGHVFAEAIADDDVRARVNPTLFRHALHELLDNAVKFSPGGGLITVGLARRGDVAEITIADQGIGIASERLESLFGDFEQADPSATRSYGGLGLGLGFVRRVVALHGGTVGVRSTLDEGSTFSLAVPVEVVPSRSAARRSSRRSAARA